MVYFPRGIEAVFLSAIGLTSTGCSLAGFKPTVPAGQTTIVPPAATPEFVGIALGVQNYTCSATGTFAAAGALAEVFDASCIAQKPSFAHATQDLFAAWSKSPVKVEQVIASGHASNAREVLAQHYFIPNPITGSGLSPAWDFRSSAVQKFRGKEEGVLVGRPRGNLPAPTDPSVDVPWLDVERVQGGVASTLFRVDTVNGQPPASCQAGETLSVKYTANYVFYA